MKNVAASTTNWAAIVALLAAVLPAFGFQLGEGAAEDVTQAVSATVVAASTIWIVVERYRKGDLFFRKPKE